MKKNRQRVEPVPSVTIANGTVVPLEAVEHIAPDLRQLRPPRHARPVP